MIHVLTTKSQPTLSSVKEKTLYLLLSASAGSIPGKLIVMADGAPTSYVLIGLWHTFRPISVLNTIVDIVLTGGLC